MKYLTVPGVLIVLLGAAAPAHAAAVTPGMSCYSDYQRISEMLRKGAKVSDAEISWALRAESTGCANGPAPTHAPDAPPPVVAAAPAQKYPSCPAAVSTVRALKASNDADNVYLSYNNAAIAAAAKGDRANLCSTEHFRLADAAIAAKGEVAAQAAGMQVCENPEHRKNGANIVSNNLGFQKQMRDAIEKERLSCMVYH